MNLLKRIGFFLLTNIAVLAVFSVILMVLQNVFGIDLQGNSTSSLILYCLIFGFTGSFLSLFMSKWLTKRTMGIQTVESTDPKFGYVYHMVEKISKDAGLKTPEVGVYFSEDVNAFATGWSKNNSLVAVSTSLLNQMSRDEIEAVIAHEIAHIKNGDMVTLTLIQGVVNAFVLFVSKIAANAIKNQFNDSIGEIAYNILYIVLQIVFGILATPIVMYFSRMREYKADAGSASLVGKDKMIAALKALQKNQEQELDMPSEMRALCISSNKKAGWFSSHPSLDERIEHLKQL